MGRDRTPPVVGVDLGGTKVLAGVVDGECRILGRAKRPTPAKDGGAAILKAIVEAIEEALTASAVSPADLAGIGVGSPGPLDLDLGVIPFSANLNVRNFALGPDLTRAMGRPVLVRNDVQVGAYGEFRLGAGRGHRELLAAFVGTGIGGCIIHDGRILMGATGNAGEVGHLIVKADGPKCGCGRRGCLEALASRSAIARRLRKAARRGAVSAVVAQLVSRSDRLKSRELAEAFGAGQGDPLVVREVHRAARFLGLALGGLINVLGPEVVIVGGGVTEALGEPYLAAVRHAARSQVLADPEGRIPIVPAGLGDDAGILGAALMARERLVDQAASAATTA